MKHRVRTMLLFMAFALIALLGLLAAIRLAPSDPAAWHIDPALAAPADATPADAPPGQVTLLEGGALLRLPAGPDGGTALLARLDSLALADPRTQRLAGSPEEGRITWITRSALWGFPDYTTADAQGDQVTLYARLRFGRRDFGVNAARLTAWKDQL